jgi:hypothetical protein
VSGTGWQTLGRAMQSITTMMPHGSTDTPATKARSGPRNGRGSQSADGSAAGPAGAHPEQFPRTSELLGTMALTEEAEVPASEAPPEQPVEAVGVGGAVLSEFAPASIT